MEQTTTMTNPASRAAKLLLLLGEKTTAKVVARIGSPDLENIARAMTEAGPIEFGEATDILSEFCARAGNRRVCAVGGRNAALRMMTAAFGPEKALKIVEGAQP